jgi:hypothetical protein
LEKQFVIHSSQKEVASHVTGATCIIRRQRRGKEAWESIYVSFWWKYQGRAKGLRTVNLNNFRALGYSLSLVVWHSTLGN